MCPAETRCWPGRPSRSRSRSRAAALPAPRRRGRRSRTPARRGSPPCTGRARPTRGRSSRSSAPAPTRSGALLRAGHRPASQPAPVRDRRAARRRAPRSRRPAVRAKTRRPPAIAARRTRPARHQQDAERKEQHAPVDQLTAADRPDRREGSSRFDAHSDLQQTTGSGVPHPQPLFPSAFATASSTQHAFASAGAGPPQHPPPAALSSVGAADAGFRQHELDAFRRRDIAGEHRHHRSRLFVSSRQQERRRAAVALHADDVEILFRDARARARRAGAPCRSCARSDRSAARAPSRIRATDRVPSRTSRQHLEIGPEAGADDHLVDIDGGLFVANRAGDAQAHRR